MKILSSLSAKLAIVAALSVGSMTLAACSDELPVASHILYSADEQPTLWSGFIDDSDYVAVIGDVQTYVANKKNYPYFEATADWLKSQKSLGANLSAVLYTGDLTDNNTEAQWRKFRDVAAPLAWLVPSVACTGNHDYDWLRESGERYTAITSRASTHISAYARFPGLEERILSRFEPESIENIIVRGEIGSRRIDIISLEFGPRPEVLRWAKEYIAAHPDSRYLLLTHELLDENGTIVGGRGFSGLQFEPLGHGYSSPTEVLEGLVKECPQIIAAICGHNGHLAKTQLTNCAGRDVPIVLYNLQYLPNGGDASLMLWEFRRDSPTVLIYEINVRAGHLIDGPLPLYDFEY